MIIRVEERFFPVVLQQWPVEMNDADLDGFFARITAINERALRANTFYVTVVVGGRDLSATQRRRVSEWANKMPPALNERNIGNYVVAENTLLRGLLTAMRWLMPKFKTVFAMANFREAVQGALAGLAERQIDVPFAGQLRELDQLPETGT